MINNKRFRRALLPLVFVLAISLILPLPAAAEAVKGKASAMHIWITDRDYALPDSIRVSGLKIALVCGSAAEPVPGPQPAAGENAAHSESEISEAETAKAGEAGPEELSGTEAGGQEKPAETGAEGRNT